MLFCIMEQDVRWKQRFENYQKALAVLLRMGDINRSDEVQRGALIHYYEITYELAWKVLKDYLSEVQGFTEPAGPKPTLRRAFEQHLIADRYSWLKALEDRNLTTHAYQEAIALKVTADIYDIYLPLMTQLRDDLTKRASK